MISLSNKEQKQIIGGGLTVFVYERKTNKYLFEQDFGFNIKKAKEFENKYTTSKTIARTRFV